MHTQSVSEQHREFQRRGNRKAPQRKRFKPAVSQQRVAIAIDVQNLYYGAKDYTGSSRALVSYEKLIERALGNRQLAKAVAYVAVRDSNNQEKFIEVIRHLGCDVRQKPVAEYNGRFKCNWDVEIAVDGMAIASKIDVFILASGDGDFSYLLRSMKAMGVRTEVISFKINTSGALIGEADRYYEMGDDMLLRRRDNGRDNGRERNRPVPDNIGNLRSPNESRPDRPELSRNDRDSVSKELGLDEDGSEEDFYEPPEYDDE